MKSQWRLFHLKQADLHSESPVYLRGINEYMTKQNAVDLITSKFSDFKAVYLTYQDLTRALAQRDKDLLQAVLNDYQTTNTEMDTTIQTLKKNQKAVVNSTQYEFSNGPLEGINRKLKTLKRTCYGFANQTFFFLRIDCLFAKNTTHISASGMSIHPYQLTDPEVSLSVFKIDISIYSLIDT